MANLTSHTFSDIPNEQWQKWQATVPRRYTQLGDRLVELLTADYLCHTEIGTGAIEVLHRQTIVDEQQLDEYRTATPKETKSHTILDIPTPLWTDWKGTVAKGYRRLGDRLIDLMCADLACHEIHLMGMTEIFNHEGTIPIDEIRQTIADAQQIASETDSEEKTNNDGSDTTIEE
ncbi:hypothetical protein [Halegenticoccus tardaugens]|uniref:hypothetical protein n=1 Tax=Halegenticoccus tardaugens TaxID=2071624 RepID=UPI00100BE673|nr:hypothetical protein [Halegenticoccus tardaugens]